MLWRGRRTCHHNLYLPQAAHRNCRATIPSSSFRRLFVARRTSPNFPRKKDFQSPQAAGNELQTKLGKVALGRLRTKSLVFVVSNALA